MEHQLKKKNRKRKRKKKRERKRRILGKRKSRKRKKKVPVIGKDQPLPNDPQAKTREKIVLLSQGTKTGIETNTEVQKRKILFPDNLLNPGVIQDHLPEIKTGRKKGKNEKKMVKIEKKIEKRRTLSKKIKIRKTEKKGIKKKKGIRNKEKKRS